jgi:hypothetical protein
MTSEDAVAFDALDSWLFHQRDLEGGVFFDLVDLARANPFVEPAVIDGIRIDPGKVQLPVLVALASRDHLVPAGSSLAARSATGSSTSRRCDRCRSVCSRGQRAGRARANSLTLSCSRACDRVRFCACAGAEQRDEQRT